MLLYKSGLNNCVGEPKIEIISPFKFSENTTYGLGGNAIAAYLPKTPYEAKIAFDRLTSNGIPFEIIGNGSNILASDKGISGAVVSTKNLRGIVRLDKNRLLCLAGTKTGELLAYCKKHRLGGLEYLYGIPASLGGAAYMNAGVSGAAIGADIESVRIYDGKSRVLTHEMCDFAYRHSTMRNIKALILSIIVNVCESKVEEIDERLSYYRQRRSHLPKGKSCGCVFKNPEGVSAGYLIENAGLKGLKVGGAHVSERHASFIVNDGGTADNVKALIEIVKSRVLEKFGILLDEEVVYIGDFNDFNG